MYLPGIFFFFFCLKICNVWMKNMEKASEILCKLAVKSVTNNKQGDKECRFTAVHIVGAISHTLCALAVYIHISIYLQDCIFIYLFVFLNCFMRDEDKSKFETWDRPNILKVSVSIPEWQWYFINYYFVNQWLAFTWFSVNYCNSGKSEWWS